MERQIVINNLPEVLRMFRAIGELSLAVAKHLQALGESVDIAILDGGYSDARRLFRHPFIDNIDKERWLQTPLN